MAFSCYLFYEFFCESYRNFVFIHQLSIVNSCFLVIITYCYFVAAAFFCLEPKFCLEYCLGAKLTAKTNISSFDDPRGIIGSTSQVTFGSPLSMDQIVFAALREPVAKRVVVDVAFDIMAKGFKVEEEAEEPNAEWSRQVSKILDELDTKEKLRELVIFERLYGWAALGLSFIDYGEDQSKSVLNPRKVSSLTVFSDHNCTIQSSDEEKNVESERAGLPNLYTVKVGSEQKKIHWTRMIHFASRKMGHPWRGVPALAVLYSDLTAYRNAREQIVHTIKTHAGGFADITLKGKKSQSQLEKFEQDNDLANLDSRTRFVHDNNSKIDWIGAKGRALDPGPYVDVSLESLSCGSRIPVSHLKGATAGTIAGSEVNDREYWGGIAMQQSLLEHTIWNLIDILMETGQIDRVEDYNLVWPPGFELSDQTIAELNLKQAQARKLQLSWMTINEVRADQGLDPLPDGAGQVFVDSPKQENKDFE